MGIKLREEHSSRVLEKELLRKIFGPEQETGENCVMRSFMVSTERRLC
jgi:hypothetical protein